MEKVIVVRREILDLLDNLSSKLESKERSKLMSIYNVWFTIAKKMLIDYDARYCIFDDFYSDELGDLDIDEYKKYRKNLIAPYYNDLITTFDKTLQEYPNNERMESLRIISEKVQTELFYHLNNMCNGRTVMSRELRNFEKSTYTPEEEKEIQNEEDTLKKECSIIYWDKEKKNAFKVSFTPSEYAIMYSQNKEDIEARIEKLTEIQSIIENGEYIPYTSISTINALKYDELRSEEQEWKLEDKEQELEDEEQEWELEDEENN